MQTRDLSPYIENDFIKELQRITQEHQRHNSPINLATQRFQVNRLAGGECAHIPMSVKILPGGIQPARDIARRWSLGVDGLLDVDGPLDAVLLRS